MTEQIKLEPCAHCGGEAEAVKVVPESDHGPGPLYRVKCASCGARSALDKIDRTSAAWNRRQPAPVTGELPTFQQVSDAQLTDDEIDTILAQKPLLTYLATRKAELEWSAEKAAHTDDDKNLRRYRAEIADLERYIESTRALVRVVMRKETDDE